MSKRRVTLNLDEDIVEDLRRLGGASVSALANEVLRAALRRRAHQLALLAWLDELDAEHGAATPEQAAEVQAFIDSIDGAPARERGAA